MEGRSRIVAAGTPWRCAAGSPTRCSLKPVRIGCSGWNYADWRERAYPKGPLPARRWLEHYATLFDTVEVNATFYRLPTRSAVAGWVEQTSPGFVFAVKASRYLTHMKRLTDLGAGLDRFYERIGAGSSTPPKIGACPLAVSPGQLPPRRRAPRRGALASTARTALLRVPACELVRAGDLRRVAGARGRSRDRRSPGAALPDARADGGLDLIRFHYGRRGRRGNYSETELEEWKGRIAAWRAKVEVFAYFNNDWEGIRGEECALAQRTPAP